MFDDPFAPEDNQVIEVKLKKLIYIEAKFDSVPKSMKKKIPSEITLPHCAELIFDRTFSKLILNYGHDLEFDSSGAISSTLIVIDYRGNGKTFSNGGDNILLKVVNGKQAAKVQAAFNKSVALYSISTQLDSLITTTNSYQVFGSTISETHTGKILSDLRIRLEKFCCCD